MYSKKFCYGGETLKKQSFLKSSAILLSMVIITKVLGLMYKIPLTHILGGTGMGYFSAAFSIFTPIFAIVVSGIPSAMAKMSAENYALGRYSNLRKQKMSAHITFGLMSIAACTIIMLFSVPLSEYVINQPAARFTLMCVAPSVVFCTAMSVERGYYEGLRNMLPTALSEIAETIFKVAFGLGAAVITAERANNAFLQSGKFLGFALIDGQTPEEAALPFVAAAAILGSTLASGLACLLLVIGTRIKGDGITEKMLKSDLITDSTKHHAKVLLHSAMPIAMAAVITTMTGMVDMLTIAPCIRRAMDKTLLPFQKLLDMGVSASELPNFMYGSYEGLAVLVYGLVPTLTAMFGKSALPSLADAWTRKDKESFAAYLKNMMTVSSIIAIPSGLGICVLAREALMFLFSGRTAEIEAAVQPLSVLGIGVIFFAITLPCFTILQTLGSPAKTIVIIAAGGVLKLLLNVLLIPYAQLNLTGAAIAETVSSAFVCILTVRETYRLGGVKCSWLETYVKPLYAGAMCAATALLCKRILNNVGLTALNHRFITIICVATGGIMYLFSLVLLCETPKKLIKYGFSKKITKNS